VKRHADLAVRLPDPNRSEVGLPIGDEAGYFVGGLGFAGQAHDPSVIDGNSPPAGQPGLWCHWVVDDDNPDNDSDTAEKYTTIVWSGDEKFYYYEEWLVYLIDHFLKPWGYTLNGEVEWQGEESTDIGKLVVKKNVVSTKVGRIVYE